MSSELIEDHIGLFEIFSTLWEEKWLIAAMTSAFGAISIAFVLLMPLKYDGSLRISSLTNQQMAAYQTLNNTPGISPPIYADGLLVGQTGVILKAELFSNFVDQLRRGSSFAAAHKSLDPKFKNFDGSRAELRQALALIGQSYIFIPDKGSNVSGVLNFKTNDRELAVNLVEAALHGSIESIRVENLAAIANLKRSIETILAFELDDVNTKLQNALANYENETIAHRALLKENAAIARQLGNADGQAISSGNSGINLAIEQQQPLYSRGYKALEKEIALIDARGKGEAAFPYVRDYIALAAEKRALESDKRLAQIEAGLAETPLVNADSFKPVNYDISSMTFEPRTQRSLIIILASLIGSFIAVIFVFIRNGLAARERPVSS